MCGIVGYIGQNKKALNVLIDSLNILEYRGYDSAGIAYVDQNKLVIIKEKGRIKNLEQKINFNIQSNLGIGHTRWATHGEPNVVNSHPHKVGKITVVHNGIIENYEELRNILKKSSYEFKSDTDTEVACALIDKLYSEKNDIIKVLEKCKDLLRGSYALGIICDDELDTLYAFRKDSPLIIALGNKENYIASDVPAILSYTNKYILLENNEIAKLTSKDIKVYNDKGTTIDKTIEIFNWNIEIAMKNGYDHFMLKEINEQPEVVKNTMQSFINFNNLELIRIFDFNKYKKIDIVACGSAYHAGLIAKYLFEKYGDISVDVEVASEYRYKKLFFDDNTLVVVISQSGETADTLAALRIAKENQVDTLAIVNVVGSSIAREAQNIIYTKAGCEIAVATTKAYSAQVAVLALLAFNMAVKKGSINEVEKTKIIKSIENLKENMINLINKNQIYLQIAEKISEQEHIFFIGRGIDYYLSMEGSLKLKEISYIHSESYPAGELKHGSIALIEKNTPVIAIATDESIFEKTISNIKEVKSRGANVILIITSDLDVIGDFYDEKIIIPTNHEFFQSLLTIIPLQLIAYEVAKLRGCDIDKPRNLAKSVTVE